MEEDIEKLIEKGENEKVEFKPSLSQLKEIVQGVCAMANSNGGIILIGVSDSKKILGIEIGKQTIEHLTNKIVDNTDHHIYPMISVKKTENKDIIVIDVKEGKEKPYTAFGRAFVRIGKNNKLMGKSEYDNVVLERKEHLFDSEIYEDANLSDINWDLVENSFIKKYEIMNKTKITSTPNNVLESLGCIKNNKPTNAGILLFGKNPQKFFMNAYIAIAMYKGKKVETERLDYKEFNGNLFSQIDNSVEYIINNIALMSKLIPGRVEREDIPEYPLFSIREIITNAVVHRDYTQKSKVIIKIFSDRIEVYNPGGLLAGITPKNIVDKQYSRNPILARVLSKVKYIEELGEGWDKIIEEHRTHPLKPKMPSIKDIDGAVIVNMFSVKDKFARIKIKRYDLNERQKFVLDYLKSNISLRSMDIQKKFNVTRDTANRDLKELIRLDLIKKEGIGKSTRYKSK